MVKKTPAGCTECQAGGCLHSFQDTWLALHEWSCLDEAATTKAPSAGQLGHYRHQQQPPQVT